MASQIGRRVGEFVLREQIGEGAFGAVFLAEQPTLEREAVVKLSHVSGTDHPERVAQFLREARLASRIDHPFAAHVYAFGAEQDGTLWIAMELVRGTSLADMLAHGPLPLEKAIPLLTRLCEVIHTAHEKGIIHQDIKPSNVMVIARAGTMFPKLLDLGIASEVQRVIGHDLAGAAAKGGGEMAGAPMTASLQRSTSTGTPLYMAPEQWVPGAPITPLTDVYSLGVVAYELLVGKPPFGGNSVMELAVAHARKPPPALPEALQSFDEVLQKAMAKRPKARYATAVELGNALRDVSGLAIDALNLPSVDPMTVDEVLVNAPQPIAESIAVLNAARTPAQLRASLWQTTTTLTQFVGAIAVALRQRTSGRHSDAPVVADFLHVLATGTLTAEQWWVLAKELVRPFAKAPALCPMPELVDLFFERGIELRTGMDALLASRALDPGAKASAEDVRTYLVGAMALLGQVLRSLKFLHDYHLVVVHAGLAESWMGMRRPLRNTVAQAAQTAADGPCLLDGQGTFVCSLAPMAACAEPSPGAPTELFLVIGAVAGKARLMSAPQPFEMRRDGVWSQLGIRTDPAHAAAEATRGDEAPYMGLSTFSAGDASRYFGREAEVLGFINRMSERPFIAVVGPSGSGKSSFIQAGVVPNMQPARMVVLMRPGADPFAALAFALTNAGVAAAREDVLELAALLARLAVADAAAPLLVVDQFEELVTLGASEATQQQFAELMLGLAASGKASVIATLRDDFLIRVAQVPALRDRLSASLHLLTTPTEEDLRRILTEPARQVGYEFEDEALVAEITREVAHQSAALALLSFTAYQLWQFRDKHFRRLARKAYHELGGVGGAMAHHAESVMAELNEAERQVVREMFRHLVTAEGTRAILSRPELLQVAGGATAAPVLETLVNARLLVAQEGIGGQERIEVIHEAILEAWPRLVKWRRDDAEGARLRDQLRGAAKQWQDRGRPRGLLWRDEALAEYRLWRARYPGALTDVENAFGAASLALDVRNRRLKRGLLTAAVTALVIGLIVLYQANARTETQRIKAQGLLDTSRYENGRALAVRGRWREAAKHWARYLEQNPMDRGLRFMASRALADAQRVQWVTAPGPAATSVSAMAVADEAILVGHKDGSLARIVAATGAVAWQRQLDSKVWRILVRGDAIYAFTATAIVELDAAGTPRQRYASDLAFGVCGRDIATTRGTVIEVRPAIGAPYRVDVGEPVHSIECAKAGTVLYFSDGGLRQLTRTGAKPLPAQAAGVLVNLQTSAQGDLVAAIYQNPNQIEVYDGATLRPVALLSGHVGSIEDVKFSPDGTSLISTDVTGDVRRWQVATGVYASLRHEHRVLSMVLASDGGVFTVDQEGTARYWMAQGLVAALLNEAQAATTIVAGDAHQAFVGYGDGVTRLLDFSSADVVGEQGVATNAWCADVNRAGQRLACRRPLELEVSAPGGRVIATLKPPVGADDYLTVSLSDRGAVGVAAQGGTRSWMYAAGGAPMIEVTSQVPLAKVVMLNDRDWLVGMGEGTLQVWDEGGQLARTITGISVDLRWALAAHPTKPWVAVHAAEDPNLLVVIDATTGARVASLRGGRQAEFALRFSGDGARLLSGGDDAVVREWELATASVKRRLEGHRGLITSLAETQAGEVISLGDDGVIVWSAEALAPDISPIVYRKTVSFEWSQLYGIEDGGTFLVANSQAMREWKIAPLAPALDGKLMQWIACAASASSFCPWKAN